MAPIRDTTRADLLRALDAGQALRVFWRNTPVAELRRDGDAWVLDTLVLNEARARTAFEAAADTGRGFRGEAYWPYYEPARRILSGRGLRIAARLMPWPPRPGPRNVLARLAGAVFGQSR